MFFVEFNKIFYVLLDYLEVFLVFYIGSVYVCVEIKVLFSIIVLGMVLMNLGFLILFWLIFFLYWFFM